MAKTLTQEIVSSNIITGYDIGISTGPHSPTADNHLVIPAIEQISKGGETPHPVINDPLSLDVISRTEWGAVPTNYQAYSERGKFNPETNPFGVLTYPQPLDDWLHTIVVHHTALPVSEGPLEIQSLHMQQRGYADVGYHFLIGTDGELYEGRPLNVRGAHVGGFNTGSVGVVLLGNMNDVHPTDNQLATLEALIHYLHQTFNSIANLAGHRDFHTGETECPGEHLYELLPEMANTYELEYGIGGYVDPPWITPR